MSTIIVLSIPLLLVPTLLLIIWMFEHGFPLIGYGIKVLFRRARKFSSFNTFLVVFRNKKIIKIQNGDESTYCIRKGWLWYRYIQRASTRWCTPIRWRKDKDIIDTIQEVGEIWDSVILNNKDKETEIFIEKDE